MTNMGNDSGRRVMLT